MELSENEIEKRFGKRFLEEFRKDYTSNEDYKHAIESALYETLFAEDSLGFANWCYYTAFEIEKYQNLKELQEEINQLTKED